MGSSLLHVVIGEPELGPWRGIPRCRGPTGSAGLLLWPSQGGRQLECPPAPGVGGGAPGGRQRQKWWARGRKPRSHLAASLSPPSTPARSLHEGGVYTVIRRWLVYILIYNWRCCGESRWFSTGSKTAHPALLSSPTAGVSPSRNRTSSNNAAQQKSRGRQRHPKAVNAGAAACSCRSQLRPTCPSG